MSAANRVELQKAVYSRLNTQLAGEGPDGGDIAVYDHVPSSNELGNARIHCRIDSFNIIQRPLKADKTSQGFTVHLFDRPTGGIDTARGQLTLAGLQETVIDVLHQWDPGVTGVTPLRHDDSEIMPDEDGLTQHAMSRFFCFVSTGVEDAMLWDSTDAMYWDSTDAMYWE